MGKTWLAVLFILIISLSVCLGFYIVGNFERETDFRSPVAKEKPLEKYAYPNLKKTSFAAKSIVLGKSLEESKDYISQMFYFKLNESRISGLLNVPKEDGVYPVLILIRGFVDSKIYSTGIGTKRGGEYFAKNGFITLAPDFLGYGESDQESISSIESRFQTHASILSLLSSLENLNSGLDASYSGKIRADISKTGIWGHSNGGQIALSVLEITGKNYPTVLWAPVSKPFPYSILYFTDEFEDHGKALRKVIADFEKDYDIEKYSPSNYYSWINAPIQIHQGTVDDAVPLKWSDNLVKDLKKLNKEIEYFTYPGADHNLMPSWNTAIERSLSFFKKKL